MTLKQSNHNIFTLPTSMRTCLDRLLAEPHVNAPLLKDEANYVAKRLEICLYEDIISNDAFLDAGAIQGALEMIANHIDMGIAQSEIHNLINQQIERASKLEIKHPGLNEAIESGR